MRPAVPESTPIRGVHELAVDASPSGVAVCDESGCILFVNPQLAATFGYRPDELVGASVDILLPERSRATHPAERQRFWSQPVSRSIGAGRELCGRRKDGSEVAIEIGLRPVTHEGRSLVIASVVDITERRQLQEQIDKLAAERLGFERVVSDVAVRFVNLPPDQVDEVIIDSQRRIVEALRIDRSALWQFTEDDQDLVYTHYWARAELPPPPPTVSARTSFPWYMERVRGNLETWIGSADDIPEGVDRESFPALGNTATAVIPLNLAGRVVGALTFGAMSGERRWEPSIRERLRLVAAIFAQGLADRKSVV